MSVKTLKRQLAASIAMVVVSAVALSSSTYAWFVNNSQVVATGMVVNAKADDSLLIKGKDTEEEYSSTGHIEVTQLGMHPATSFDGEIFGKLSSDVNVSSAASSVATWTGSGGTFNASDIVTVDSSEATNYYLTGKYQIKSVADADNTNVCVSEINVTKKNNTSRGDKDIYTSLRVSVKIGEKTLVYKPTSAAVNNGGVVGKYNDNVPEWELAEKTYDKMGTSLTAVNNAYWTISNNVDHDVTIKIWFEGQDTQCYTNNIDTSGVDVTVTFVKTN